MSIIVDSVFDIVNMAQLSEESVGMRTNGALVENARMF